MIILSYDSDHFLASRNPGKIRISATDPANCSASARSQSQQIFFISIFISIEVQRNNMCEQLFYAAQLFSIATTATAKISLLCLYRRIFSTPSFRWNSLVVIGFVAAYWVTSSVSLCLQCIPVEKLWTPTKEGRCINFAAAFLGLELWNCSLDIVMLCLPLNVIRGLQMSTRLKLQLAVLFFLGSV